ALQEQFLELPQNISGIEVGLGTGRFSKPLGIKEGIEPSREMAAKAIKRGIEIMEGTAEHLPYAALQFDFVLFVTVCFLTDIKRALREAHRVLKPNGAIIIGFLDKERSVAKQYIDKKNQSNFYGNARFYTVDRLTKELKSSGFKDLVFNQTLFGNMEEIEEVQVPKKGHGEGSFITVKAIKK
ncbi:MAG: class I SAM-dependent methyltransferase, partial [Eudoraea sp.]|nr:methyltransferase domain-containing protein [Eudoraea sp.]NNL00826.1 class I SAM-dependent methyltransferase [Eudoraea sp.]